MAYHPRIEGSEITSFVTSRTRNSELWFINNRPLQNAILGFVAKYTNKYKVKLYAFGIQGNHLHHVAKFPEGNRYCYARVLNSQIAKEVKRCCAHFSGGTLWHRRYSAEYLMHEDDIEEYFLYTALQPVNDGLVEKISDYPEYNFFNDAINGIKRKVKYLNRTKYYEARRYNPAVKAADFIETYELSYERLPGYENLSQAEYRRIMLKKLEERRVKILKERAAKGKSACLGRKALLQIRPGSRPYNTKKTGRYDHRPRVLSICNKRRAILRDWYFGIYSAYKDASYNYRTGKLDTKFPDGTFKPPNITILCRDSLTTLMN